MAGNRGLTKLHESYTLRAADTGVNEAANAAEFSAASVARKQTNKGRAVEDLAKSAAAAVQRHAADAASEDDKEAAIDDKDASVFANRR